jgi:hypothetical protein
VTPADVLPELVEDRAFLFPCSRRFRCTSAVAGDIASHSTRMRNKSVWGSPCSCALQNVAIRPINELGNAGDHHHLPIGAGYQQQRSISVARHDRPFGHAVIFRMRDGLRRDVRLLLVILPGTARCEPPSDRQAGRYGGKDPDPVLPSVVRLGSVPWSNPG